MKISAKSIGIICFYNSQRLLINHLLNLRVSEGHIELKDLEVENVDSFQVMFSIKFLNL